MNISTKKNSRDTPTSATYPSSGKIGGEIIKLYQFRRFYIQKAAADKMFLEFGDLRRREQSSLHCGFTSEYFLISLPEKHENRIVTVYCKKIGDRNRIYGFSFCPGALQVSCSAPGLFHFSNKRYIGVYLPVSNGGTHARDNRMSLCQSCQAKIHHDLSDR